MARILIVDDNPGDRELVSLAFRHEEDALIVQAENGEVALAECEACTPDLVLTDLRMPKMDGLALIDELHIKYPRLPVVVMTSFGSENVAVEALQRGAASYISKQTIDKRMVSMVQRVLHSGLQHKNRQVIASSLRHYNLKYELDNDPSRVSSIVSVLMEHLRWTSHNDENDPHVSNINEGVITRTGVALQEAIDNAIYHGNLELDSQIREEDARRYYQLADERRTQTPFAERRVYVEVNRTPDETTYIIRDEGSGFNPSILSDPTSPENMEKVSGRGLLLIRTFMDQVSHNDSGNEITMIRKTPELAELAAH